MEFSASAGNGMQRVSSDAMADGRHFRFGMFSFFSSPGAAISCFLAQRKKGMGGEGICFGVKGDFRASRPSSGLRWRFCFRVYSSNS